MLTCPNCGFEVEPSPPMSIDTADVQGMPAPDAPGAMDGAGAEGPAEGDLCPACGKAPLQSANELAEEGMTPPEADGEPDAERGEVGDKVEDDQAEPAPFEKDDSEDPDEDPDERDAPYPDDNDDSLEEKEDNDDDSEEQPRRKNRGFR
jgi:hypothetical protein